MVAYAHTGVAPVAGRFCAPRAGGEQRKSVLHSSGCRCRSPRSVLASRPGSGASNHPYRTASSRILRPRLVRSPARSSGPAGASPRIRRHTDSVPRHQRAPVSHATARPRQASTSFESQVQHGAGRRNPESAHRDLSTLRARLTAIPARPATPTNNWAGPVHLMVAAGDPAQLPGSAVGLGVHASSAWRRLLPGGVADPMWATWRRPRYTRRRRRWRAGPGCRGPGRTASWFSGRRATWLLARRAAGPRHPGRR